MTIKSVKFCLTGECLCAFKTTYFYSTQSQEICELDAILEVVFVFVEITGSDYHESWQIIASAYNVSVFIM